MCWFISLTNKTVNTIMNKKLIIFMILIMIYLCCFYAAINRALDINQKDYDYLIQQHKAEIMYESRAD